MTPLSLTSHSLIHPQILLILLLKYILNMTTFYLLCCSHPGSIHDSLWPDFLKQLVCVPSPPSPPFSLLSAPEPEDPVEVCQLESLFCSKPSSDFFPLTRIENQSPHHYCEAVKDLPCTPTCRSSFFDLSPAFLSLALETIPPLYQHATTPGLLHLFCCFCMASALTFFVSLYFSLHHLPMRSFWPSVQYIIIQYTSHTFPALLFLLTYSQQCLAPRRRTFPLFCLLCYPQHIQQCWYAVCARYLVNK